MNPTTVSFKTVGCRLNQAETATLRAAFETAGYSVVPFGQTCDVCVVHGCTVTANAQKDSLRLARSAKRMNPGAFVVLAGCVAEIGGEPLRAACGADLAVGQAGKFELPAILHDYGFCQNPVAARRPGLKLLRFETTRAIVKIQDGCDFRCAYCIVPAARGRSRSRPVDEVIREIIGLGESGYREIVLTGANIGCYDDNGKKLVYLLEQIDALSTIDRMRISSIEISTVERAVIDLMSQSSKLCRSLHFPLQSGDDRILQAMGRRYTARQYRELIEYAVRKLGPIGLGADALVGFPGEDSPAFAATEQLIRDLPFSNLHVFAYSRRKSTRACDMSCQVPDVVRKKRAARLISLGRQKRESFARYWVGRETTVLVESVETKGDGVGWTGEYLKARVRGQNIHPNQIVRFVPDHVDGDVLVGEAGPRNTGPDRRPFVRLSQWNHTSIMGPLPGGGPRRDS